MNSYSDKSFVVYGKSTLLIIDKLKSAGGKWNPRLTREPFAGWIFPNTKLEEVKKIIQQIGDGEKIIQETEKEIGDIQHDSKKIDDFWNLLKEKVSYDFKIDKNCEGSFSINGYIFEISHGTRSDNHHLGTRFIISNKELDIYFHLGDNTSIQRDDDEDIYESNISRCITRCGEDLPSAKLKKIAKDTEDNYTYKDCVSMFVNLLILGKDLLLKKNIYKIPHSYRENKEKRYIIYTKYSKYDEIPKSFRNW